MWEVQYIFREDKEESLIYLCISIEGRVEIEKSTHSISEDETTPPTPVSPLWPSFTSIGNNIFQAR